MQLHNIKKWLRRRALSCPPSNEDLGRNYRDFARASVVRGLKTFVRHHNPVVIFLTETKIAADQVQAILNMLGFYLLFQCPPMVKKGGLVLTWRQGVEIEHIFSNENLISSSYILL